MALPDGLAALFRLTPERASAFLKGKSLKLSGPYWELDGPEHSRNFTVANLAKLDVLADIKAAVQGAMDQGQTETWFKQQLVDTLKAKGWWGPTVSVDPVTGEARMMQQGSLRRLQTIYRTNLQSAYMAGRHAQALEQADRAPFAQYLSVRDSRSRPAHAALHGKVFRLDSPEWSIISPPNGYNCRCRARYMSQRELDKRNLQVEGDARLLERTPEKVPTDPLTGESPERIVERGVSVPSRTRPGERDVLWADRGWDHLPGSDGAERALVDRTMAAADAMGGGIRQLILRSAPAPLAARLGLPDLFSAVSAAEGQIAGSAVEVTVVFDAAGQELLRKSGNADSVAFAPAEWPLLRDAVITHNHPPVTSFSPGDIALLLDRAAAEVRAVDARYSYSAQRPPGGWDPGDMDAVRQAAEDAESEVWGEWTPRLLRGEMTEADFGAGLYHEIWSRVAQRTRLIYSRTVRQP